MYLIIATYSYLDSECKYHTLTPSLMYALPELFRSWAHYILSTKNKELFSL